MTWEAFQIKPAFFLKQHCKDLVIGVTFHRGIYMKANVVLYTGLVIFNVRTGLVSTCMATYEALFETGAF